MTRIKFFTLLLVHLFACPAVTQRSSRALYPMAYRIKRGTYLLINPTFQRSQKEVDLLFEILLAGMQIEGKDHRLLIPDEELASLRQVKKLEVICEDVLPKKLSELRRLADQLSQQKLPMSLQDYERTVLTLVYITQTLAQLGTEPPREAWGDVLIQLFNALQKDLTTS